MRFGVHENYQGPDATDLARTVKAFPQGNVTREFEAGVIPPQDLVKRIIARCLPIWKGGKTAVWSFKPDPAAVASGAWKPYVLALGKYIVDNGLQDRTVVVIWHEPENDVAGTSKVPVFKGPTDFVALFNAVHDWLMSVSESIVTSHAALGYAYRDKAMSDEQARKWVTKATVHSIDIYSGRAFPLAMTLGTSTGFRRWKATRPAGCRWGVSERGFIATDALSALRVSSIDAESDYLAALSFADLPDFYVVWNTEGTENDPTIILDQPGTDAVNRMFKRLTPDLEPVPATIDCPLCVGSGEVEPGTYTIVRVTLPAAKG